MKKLTEKLGSVNEALRRPEFRQYLLPCVGEGCAQVKALPTGTTFFDLLDSSVNPVQRR